jgi:rare lipoprotein A
MKLHLTIIALIVLLGAPSKSDTKEYFPPPPYTVGRTSWYGQEFQGNETANEERFNRNAMTAANLTLPLGTKIRVTNLGNGKSVNLRINDRGPYVAHRMLDVSQAAAKKLGFVGAGLAWVKVEIISYPKPKKAL